GGSILIRAGVLNGRGQILAQGAPNPSSTSPGGGGGRIALIVDSIDPNFNLNNVSAAGGSGPGDSSVHGGAGTIYIRRQGEANGELIVDNKTTDASASWTTPLPSIAPGTIT